MVSEMLSWGRLDDDRMTREKAHRWLGYIQGCIVAGGGATLEDMKRVNTKVVGA
jgi:hypothetical protein